MLAQGGSVKSASIDGRDFSIAADTDATIKLGGPSVLPNGDSTVRYIAEIVAWAVEGLEIAIDNSNGDLKFLQDNADAMSAVNCTMTLIDDTVYQGKGIVVSPEYSSSKATATLALMGEGDLLTQ